MSCKGNHSDICIDTRLLAHLGDALSRRSEVERFLSDFFNASTINLAIIDERLRYRMVNPYLAASHKAPLELHLGKHLREILGAVAAQVEPSSRRVFVTTRPIINCEISGA